MASDEIIWDIINQQFCAFKIKLPHRAQTFCRNEYNATGLCNRQSCPLANSRYATIRAAPDTNDQTLYLYTKTAERAHLPSRMWEKTKLSANYAQALEQVDGKLAYWPKYMIHRCKQRLTRLTQVKLRTRRLAKEEARLGERVVPRLAPKVRKREEVRERKAERAAKVERAVERELLERLRSGAYGDKPLNVEEGIWQKVLAGLERDGAEKEEELEAEEEEEEELEDDGELEFEDEEGVGDIEYVSDIGESDDEDEEDVEEAGAWLQNGDSDDESASDDSKESEEDEEKLKKALNALKRKRADQPPPKPNKKKPSKGPKRKIEYEIETEGAMREPMLA